MEPITNQAQSVSLYQDVRPLKNLKGQEGLEAVAEQFEGMFMKMMLKSMRDASNTLAGKDSLFNTQQHRFYQDMADSQMAMELSGTAGLGIADAMIRQMGGQINNEMKSDSIPNKMVGSAHQQPLVQINRNQE